MWMHRSVLGALLSWGAVGAVVAQAPADNGIPEVVIVAPYGVNIDRDLVPANVQSANSEDIQRLQPLDLSDLLNRSFGSVNINHAQSNPLQPDLNFRGFTASPLLGLPVGLSVYQNGARVNEPFGDTVNWDLIASSAIEDVQMIAGANPVFGLNTLGGALSVRMKTGFSFQGTEAQVSGGSFDRRGAVIQSGGNNGRWGYYANADYFEEDGWRDFSASEATRVYGAVSFRGDDDASLDLSLAHADTKLRGNGSSPAELLAADRSAVFTYPDITQNKLTQLILEGTKGLSDKVSIGGNAYFRDLQTRTFNGDGTVFEECDVDGEELLVEGECDDDSEDVEPVRDQNGDPIEAELDDSELNAINNISRREQKAYGLSGQITLKADAFARKNQLSMGAAWTRGDTDFTSAVEVASLLEDRSTSRTGIFADDFRTAVDSSVDTYSLYLVDTLSLTDRIALTLAGRYNDIRIELEDRSGISPDLNGRHEFSRFNPAAGVTMQLERGMNLYASVGESARAPSPVELACASEAAPCNLPNAFLADPPLEQVVAHNAEIGLRGGERNQVRWNIGAFFTTNENDILFQTTGGPQANVGFFDNVADTRRAGIEIGLSQTVSRVSWSAEYSYVKATFEDNFVVNSPNHPMLDDTEEEKLLVPKGATIPGVPHHQANLSLGLAANDRLQIGGDVNLRSGVYLRGDEVNLLGKTPAFAVFNVHAQYRLSDHAVVLARIENLFDKKYETFGILGEPQEVFPAFSDPRFYGAGPPFGAWVGVKFRL
jgi:iron complex outermembrane recepter protein